MTYITKRQREIVAAAAAAYEIEVDELFAGLCAAPIPQVRAAAIYAGRLTRRYSWKSLAAMVGLEDHTSAQAAFKRAEKAIARLDMTALKAIAKAQEAGGDPAPERHPARGRIARLAKRATLR